MDVKFAHGAAYSPRAGLLCSSNMSCVDIGRADEIRHKAAGRAVVNLLRCPDLLHITCVEYHDLSDIASASA